MGKLATVSFDDQPFTLSLVSWGFFRRHKSNKQGFKQTTGAPFIPKYELAIYKGEPSVVFRGGLPEIVFYYLDKSTARARLEVAGAAIATGGIFGAEFRHLISNTEPQQQHVWTVNRELAELLRATGSEPAKTVDQSGPELMTAKSDDKEAWEGFRGVANTEHVLRQKAWVVSKLIDDVLDDVFGLAKEIKKETTGVKSDTGDDHDFARQECAAETTALLIHVASWFASSILSSEEREHFTSALETFAGDGLRARGLRYEFKNLLRPRLAEYAHYKSWVPTGNKGNKGTLLHEYAKKVAFNIDAGKNAMFNVILSNFLLRQLKRWNLRDLIRD